MPFRSKKQARFMFLKHPRIAKRWASHTRSIKRLPMRVGKSGRAKSRKKR